MYERILLPVDHSSHALDAAAFGLAIAGKFDARVTGLYVDTADSRDNRQERMLANLPEEVRNRLEAKEAAPSGPAAAVLESITSQAMRQGAFFRPVRLSGNPLSEIHKHIDEQPTDLVVLGAKGDGADANRALGSITERMARHGRTDLLIIKRQESLEEGDGGILVAVDGSAQSYAGLLSAISIAAKTNRTVEAVGVYDPYIHYTLFNGIVKVLTEKAAKVFKFADQEKLHEEIIDTGLAKIYQAHLEVARTVAEDEGVELKITLLDGKAYEKLLQYIRKTDPWLLVMGRIGVHSGPEMDIGSNSENLLLQAACNTLLVSRTHTPQVDVQAAESTEWTPSARQKMERVPEFVRGVATTAIIRWAMERGFSVITETVINSAMGDLLPADAAQAMGYVAEEIAINADDMHQGKTYLCPTCGYAARDFQPVACAVCKTDGSEFQRIDREVLESIGSLETGALEVDEHPDGYKLEWTMEAKNVMAKVPKGYERRRSKARIEKTARVRGITRVTQEFATDMIEQDMAETSYLSDKGERLIVELEKKKGPDDKMPLPRSDSSLMWTEAAWKRICRVPSGFMRSMTMERVEQFATEQGQASVNLALCEDGIAEGRKMMAEMIGDYTMSSEKKTEIKATVDKAPELAETSEPIPVSDVLSKNEQDTIAKFRELASDVSWTDAGEDEAQTATARAVDAGKFQTDRAEELVRGVAEERARDKRMEEITGSFMAKLGKQLGYGHPLAKVTAEHSFTWTEEALAELEDIPEFCREMSKWRVEWTAVKMDLGTVITPEIMKIKYDMWGEVSENYLEREGQALSWAPETKARLENIPDFVKGQVIHSVEGNARLWGVSLVDNEILDKVIQKWIETGDFHEGKYGYQ
ncbi:MAG: universal stress protein [Myxococcota bacterium]|nr:universal stress protein [Myxococcota bacterium]